MSAPPLLPRRLLFDNPERRSPRLSPDGVRLSWLAPDEGVLNVFVAPSNDPSAARPLTRDRGRGVPDHAWAFTNRHVLHVQDANGDENWQILVTDVESGETRELTPKGSLAAIGALSWKHPTKVFLAVNDRDPQMLDPCLADLVTGEIERIAVNDRGIIGFVADSDLRLRLGKRIAEDGGHDVLRWIDGRWEPWLSLSLEDSDTTDPVGYEESGALLMTDGRGRDTSALVRMDESGATTVLASSPEADVADVLRDPRTGVATAAEFERHRRRWVGLDPTVGTEISALERELGGDLEFSARSLDDRRWVVSETRGDAPHAFWLRDRDARTTTKLFTTRPALEGATLARMHPLTIRSRDGLDLVSYLSLPPDADRGGRPDSPLPAILLVHGGPWHRDQWGFNPYHQLFANRGLAVLAVNFRGSTGFGKSFMSASYGQWGAAMQDDLEDAVAWMVREGVADPARIAIMGGSYGGYATLVGMTRTPELFACGVDIVGVSNLLTFLETIPPYWKPIIRTWTSRVADPATEAGRRLLQERSPLGRAGAIRRPLLIAQGAHDPRVKKSESDQIVAAMQEHGIPVTYCVFEDEGHGFRRPENNLAFIAITESFLGKHLGCRSAALEPADLAGSSVHVVAGADGVPGLPEALTQT